MIRCLVVSATLVCIGCKSSKCQEGEAIITIEYADGISTLTLRGLAVDPISQQHVESATVEIVWGGSSEYRSVAAATQSDVSGEFNLTWKAGWSSAAYSWPEDYPEEKRQEDTSGFRPFTLVVQKAGCLDYVRIFERVPYTLPGKTIYAGTVELQPLQ